MYTEILKHRIRELREIKGFKQEDVAHTFDVSQGTYNNWETGRRTPELKTILRIADFYDVELDYLFGRNVATARRIKES